MRKIYLMGLLLLSVPAFSSMILEDTYDIIRKNGKNFKSLERKPSEDNFSIITNKIEFLRSLQQDDKNEEERTSDPFAIAIFEGLKDYHKKHIAELEKYGKTVTYDTEKSEVERKITEIGERYRIVD